MAIWLARTIFDRDNTVLHLRSNSYLALLDLYWNGGGNYINIYTLEVIM